MEESKDCTMTGKWRHVFYATGKSPGQTRHHDQCADEPVVGRFVPQTCSPDIKQKTYLNAKGKYCVLKGM